MKKIKILRLLGALAFFSILFAGCANNIDSGSSGSDSEETADETPENPKGTDDAGGEDGNDNGGTGGNGGASDDAAENGPGFRSISTESLINRDVYIFVYIPGGNSLETEHWYYDSTNRLTNYAVTTTKFISSTVKQEVIYVFTADPGFTDSRTGASSMYDTDAFVTTHNPEAHNLYAGKYIYRYSNGNCVAGGYLAKGETSIRSGCFNATYGDYGYTSFTESETGTVTVSNNEYTITPDTTTISEYRVCEYDSTIQNYVKESFYSEIPASSTDDTHLIRRYTCVYNSDNEPTLEVKYEPRRVSEAPNGSAGTYGDGENGELNSNTSSTNAEYASKIVFEFNTNRHGDITVQKSFLYNGTAAIPVAANVTRDDYSDDNELAILTRDFDSHNRKTREVETSYGNKVKTVVLHYDEGTDSENGLASETTYDSNDLMVSRATYSLIDFDYSNAGNTPVTGDTETYETKNYEYNTTRSYHERLSTSGLTVKRPRTIHWCER